MSSLKVSPLSLPLWQCMMWLGNCIQCWECQKSLILALFQLTGSSNSANSLAFRSFFSFPTKVVKVSVASCDPTLLAIVTIVIEKEAMEYPNRDTCPCNKLGVQLLWTDFYSWLVKLVHSDKGDPPWLVTALVVIMF